MKTTKLITLVSVAALSLLLDAPSKADPVPLQEATATFAQTIGTLSAFGVEKAIDGLIGDSGWGLYPDIQAHTAVFETRTDVGFPGGSLLTFTLHQTHGNPGHNLGRFRLCGVARQDLPSVVGYPWLPRTLDESGAIKGTGESCCARPSSALLPDLPVGLSRSISVGPRTVGVRSNRQTSVTASSILVRTPDAPVGPPLKARGFKAAPLFPGRPSAGAGLRPGARKPPRFGCAQGDHEPSAN